jgi:MOB kinase activator 1
MLWGAIAELCTGPECSIMSAGPKYEYHWADGKEIKKAIKVSANQYAGYLFEWVKKQIDDQTIFPVKNTAPFPPNYLDKVKHIFKRLFRVYAHVYHAHFQHVVTLGIEAHVNTSFKHFIFFVLEFDLIDKKELAPLAEFIDSMTSK